MKKIFTAWLVLAVLFSVSSSGQTQTIKGMVYDEASGAPLQGVIITVNTNPQQGAATDSNGVFRIANVKIGRYTIKLSYISYEERVLNDIDVTAGKEVYLKIAMQEALRNMKEVSVVYDRSKDKNQTVNDMAMVSARSFNVDETKLYAGSLGDPSRMAANFAGIVAGNDSRNDIVVRGNSPDGMLWQIDGLNTPNPNHFGALNSTGGPVSMLNNNNIDKSDFLTGAFPPQYGNALAGVFDIHLRDGNSDKQEYVAQAGFNGFEGGMEGPIGKNKQTSYLINYRYTTIGVFKALGINIGTGTSTPIYQDVNYKLVSKLNKRSKISLFGIAGNSKVDFLGKDVDTTKPDLYSGGDPYKNLRPRYSTTITGVSYDYQISDKSSTRFTLGYCTTNESFSVDSISYLDASIYPNQNASFKTAKASTIWTFMHKFNAKNNIQSGIVYDHTQFDLINKTEHPGQPDDVRIDQSGGVGLLQAYTQWKHRFNNNISFVAGLHFMELGINNTSALEPRMSVRYKINNKNAVSLGYGLHDQQQSIYSYYVQTYTPQGILFTNKNLAFTQSQHIVASYDLNLTGNMRIKVETYYQALNNVPVNTYSSSYSALNEGLSFGPPDQDSLTNKGTGYNYGAEITIEHFLDHGFYFLITTSLINSKYKGSDGIERNTAFNTGYVANVLAGKEFSLRKNSKFGVNIKLSSIGGKYLTPIDIVASQAQGKAVYYKSLAFADKQPDYFRTDLKLSYKREYKKSTMEFSIDLENITNHKNIFDQTYDNRKNQVVNNYQQGFFPVPAFRMTF